MRIYVAGPMSGYLDCNYPAFHAAATAWRAAGWEVVNPAENFGGQQGLPYADYMRQDLTQLLTCDAIALLPGWEKSKGASLEHHVAVVLELRILDAQAVEPVPGETRPALEPEEAAQP
jgi:hypothetical protein